ncbi:uncharacterized protein LOC132701086 [Cylas formicarius]|uniref:uncharacterized protein LOC132701086 n=1 Tax=Cylas formicarius TaxID=197179 RepID=UPI002958A469|nr:uncharacterized protein LOC132701086 [Cylas formicarius]
MCATAAPALLFVLVQWVLMTLLVTRVTSAPLGGESAPDDGVLAGQDFLSVFLESSMRRNPRPQPFEDATEPYARASRETSPEETTEAPPPTTTTPADAKSVAPRDNRDLATPRFNVSELIGVGGGARQPPPFHHSFIYHDGPREAAGRARSVSYSTVIRAAPEAAGKGAASDGRRVYGRPEQNYEVDETLSVETNGRTHGVQAKTPTIDAASKEEDGQKVGYVVEGRNYRKYRVEERTADGFIVGEYGVVSNDDGSLRGVRYTADGTINPRLIYDALMKFLSL